MTGERTADLPAGFALDQFRVVGPLGRGGMGVVYEAEDTLLHRQVAIKTLSVPSPADPSASALLREAQAAARLEHPNVVRVYHVGRWEGGLYLVMELARGGSLQSLVNPTRPLRWEAAVRAVAQACRGLAAAHAVGFVHRDVKPANLMLDEAGRVKVADFGLVRGGDLTTTVTGRVVGTPHYMSPEQCRGEAADARSDVYALGATYFALLTGRPPFPLPTPMQVMFAHCSQPPPDPCAVVPGLPAGCGEVVRTAMAKSPADRYPTAAAMLAALKALTAAAPPEPLPLPAATPADTAADWGTKGNTTRSVRPVRPARKPRRGPRLVVFAVLTVAAVGVIAAGVAVGWSLLAGSTARVSGPGTAAAVAPRVAPVGGERQVAGGVRAVALSADGRWVAAGGPDGGAVWDATDPKVEYPLPWHDVTGMEWGKYDRPENGGPDVVWLLAAAREGPVTWLSSTRTAGNFIDGWGDNSVNAAVVKPGRTAISISGGHLNGEIRTYIDMNTGPVLRTESGKAVRQLVLAPGDDDTLAVVDVDGAIELHTPGGERRPPPPFKSKAMPRVVAFHPTTNHLAVAEGDWVSVWDGTKRVGDGMKLPAEPSRDGPTIHALAFSPDGKLAATADDAGGVHLWDVPNQKRLTALPAGDKPARCVAFSADGKTLASGDDAGRVRVWAVDAAGGRGKP